LESLLEWAESFPDRQPQDYVFPSERAGGVSHKFGKEGKHVRGKVDDTDVTKPIGSIKTGWKEAQKRASVPCRIHDLRHTATTRMLEAGIPIHQIGEIQGWSASQLVLMIRRYSHFSTPRHRKAVEAIDLMAQKSRQFEESHQNAHQPVASRHRPDA
jgi:integrase